jgi:peptide/nickel transport system permease protein
LSLLIYGARQSLFIGLTATAIGTLLGGLLGLIAGYAGRTVDMALMRLLDIWMSVPDVLLVIILATALTPSTTNMILTIGIVLVPRYARVMRSQVIAIKGQPYVEASRAIGASHAHLLIRHILPQTLSPMLVMVTLGIAGAVLMVAMLSFIGLGVIDDIPDWGYLLSQGRSYLTVAWWFGTFPGLAITALVISVNLLGEALRHRLDPRSQAR